MGRTIQALDRAVGIMETLAGEPAGLSLSQLSQRLALAPQTVQSLLRTLEVHEYVTQTGRGHPYLLGPKLVRLSRQWLQGRGLGEVARGVVVALSERVGEYVLLAELRGRTVAVLVEVTPQQGLIVRSELHPSNRLHTMATGRLLLAYAAETTREELLAGLPLQNTAARRKLTQQLELIRKQGFALLLEEAGPGIAALAVPIREGQQTVAALGIALPLVRFSPQRKRTLLSELQAAAKKIEEAWV